MSNERTNGRTEWQCHFLSCSLQLEKQTLTRIVDNISTYLWWQLSSFCYSSPLPLYCSINGSGESQDQISHRFMWVTRSGKSQDEECHKFKWVTSLGESQDQESYNFRWVKDQGSYKIRSVRRSGESQDLVSHKFQWVTRSGESQKQVS